MNKKLLSGIIIAAASSLFMSAQNVTPTEVWKEKSKILGELYGQRASLFELLPITSEDIVFVGNSLTHGCEWHELFNMPNVKNRGINGDIIEGIDQRIAPVLKGKPKKIFLLVGVNDVSHNLTADSIATATGKLIDRIRRESPETRLYVQSLLPINNSFRRYKNIFGKEQVIRDINTRLSAMADEKGFTWINVRPIFADKDDNLDPQFTNDGLHLLGPAYLCWRDFLLPYINE